MTAIIAVLLILCDGTEAQFRFELEPEHEPELNSLVTALIPHNPIPVTLTCSRPGPLTLILKVTSIYLQRCTLKINNKRRLTVFYYLVD